ncbi:MAG: hypothetical protein ACK4H7_04325 [Acidilobaceae archaeon]
MLKRIIVTNTVAFVSDRLPGRVYSVFVELEGMYRNMVEQLAPYAAGEDVKSF